VASGEPGGVEAVAEALAATPSSADPVVLTPLPPRARLSARFQPALNAALWQNHVPVLSELALSNDSDEPIGDVDESVKNLGQVACSSRSDRPGIVTLTCIGGGDGIGREWWDEAAA